MFPTLLGGAVGGILGAKVGRNADERGIVTVVGVIVGGLLGLAHWQGVI